MCDGMEVHEESKNADRVESEPTAESPSSTGVLDSCVNKTVITISAVLPDDVSNNAESMDVKSSELEQTVTSLDDVSNNAESMDVKSSELEKTVTSLDDVYSAAIQLERVTKITEAISDFVDDRLENNYIKGCKWAPDGTCVLTCSEDNKLRIFNLPEVLYRKRIWGETEEIPKEIRPAITATESGAVFDYCWYPRMTSYDPLTCCIASCSKKCPVHLWDAFDGSLRATYNPYNQVDEVEGAFCVAFSPTGEKLYTGFHSCIRVFDIARPGRICEKRQLKGKHLTEHQKGIVSSISVNPVESKIYAVGSYQRALGLYGEPDGTLLCLLNAHSGGITHTQFSKDGTKLFSGSRKDPEILCWDLRRPGKLLASIRRSVETNQRIYFDLSDEYLFSGNTCGKVTAYNLSDIHDGNDSSEIVSPCFSWDAHKDCANGVSVHPFLPIVASSSGQRHFPCENNDYEENSDSVSVESENALVLWWLGPH